MRNSDEYPAESNVELGSPDLSKSQGNVTKKRKADFAATILQLNDFEQEDAEEDLVEELRLGVKRRKALAPQQFQPSQITTSRKWDPVDERHFCQICNRTSYSHNKMVFCDNCNTPYHQLCHQPPVSDSTIRSINKWFCSKCRPPPIVKGFTQGMIDQGLSMAGKRASLHQLSNELQEVITSPRRAPYTISRSPSIPNSSQVSFSSPSSFPEPELLISQPLMRWFTTFVRQNSGPRTEVDLLPWYVHVLQKMPNDLRAQLIELIDAPHQRNRSAQSKISSLTPFTSNLSTVDPPSQPSLYLDPNLQLPSINVFSSESGPSHFGIRSPTVTPMQFASIPPPSIHIESPAFENSPRHAKSRETYPQMHMPLAPSVFSRQEPPSSSPDSHHSVPEPPPPKTHAVALSNPRSEDANLRHCSSNLRFYTPLDIDHGLCKLVVDAAYEIYESLDRLENSGLGLGFDILPRDIPLSDKCDHERFTGQEEMLWIQYEAREQLDVTFVKKILTKIANHIQPFSVAAFDRGQFGVGLILNDLELSCSESDSTNDIQVDSTNLTNANSLPGPSLADWEPESDRPTLSSNLSNGSRGLSSEWEDQDEVIGDFNRQPPSNDAGDGIPADNSSFLFQRMPYGAPVKCSSNKPKTNQNEDDKGEENSDGEDPDDPQPSEPVQQSFRRRNDRFSGTVTLRINETLKQELTSSIGLRIRPVPGEDFADCEITLNPVQVMASSLFSEQDEDDLETAVHFYVTEQVKVLVRPCNGYCEAPESVHPLPHHFQERVTKSMTTTYGASLEISASPKLVLKGGKGQGLLVEQPGVIVGLEVGHIGSSAGKGFQWNYKPVGPYGTNLELSSSNPPIHRVKYRVYNADTPDFIKLVIRATFRQNAKLTRAKSRHHAALRILRDLRAMHVITTLEVKIGNEENDWFLFPNQDKEGRRLQKTVTLEDGRLWSDDMQRVHANGVIVQLKVS